MLEFVARSSGVFFVPQMTLSVITLAVVLGYAVAFLRGELAAGSSPWRRTLDPLAGLAVTVGLLGSVVSFCIAFDGFRGGGFDVERITAGLATAYVTTAVGLVTSLMAGVGSYLLGVLVKAGEPTSEND
jgi:hypothetical protein